MYMPPIESVVATSSMLIYHYWSPYLYEGEVCFGGSTYWFGTLEDKVLEVFNCPNCDPDRNKFLYLKALILYNNVQWHNIHKIQTSHLIKTI
jgi:hypothetical protein